MVPSFYLLWHLSSLEQCLIIYSAAAAIKATPGPTLANNLKADLADAVAGIINSMSLSLPGGPARTYAQVAAHNGPKPKVSNPRAPLQNNELKRKAGLH